MKVSFRSYITGRLLGLHVFGVLALSACLALSNWQWDRAHVWNAKSQDSLQVVQPFNELSPLRNYLPATSIGAKTEVTGSWITNSVRTYCGRPADGSILRTGIEIGFTPGCWVTGVLSLQDGTVLTAVLGWSADNSGVQGLSVDLPPGSVKISGVLQPSEDSLQIYLPAQAALITTKQTVSQVGQSAHDGYLLVSSPRSGLQSITPVFEMTPAHGVHWRNVVYTFNWLFFGLFVIFMWWRAVRDELAEVPISTDERE